MHLLGRPGLNDPARRPDGELFRRGRLELERDAVRARVVQAERGGDVLAELEAEAELRGCCRGWEGGGGGRGRLGGRRLSGERGRGGVETLEREKKALALPCPPPLAGFSPTRIDLRTWVQLQELPGRHGACFSSSFASGSKEEEEEGKENEK